MNVHQIRSELLAGRSFYDLSLRVTYYARVSTDTDEQRGSLENQMQYYEELIRSRPNWSYVPGYVDEGISGTSTRRRDSFNRMIADAKSGRFDFIITKEISRFSRSTLDSIQFTQELLENGVGVFFQNDNINTLDTDSEFRLVVMAGVAQDEVRKLSERLKFGFRQAIKNGHVLGNDTLWGYDKRGCVLTVNEEEAAVVRHIFDLYANRELGLRRISQALWDEGITSRQGGVFNVLTIRHILTNPKYKGWYCAGRSRTVDYRSKRKVYPDPSEWVLHPDPAIPALVSEELWDRANALYQRRSRQAAACRHEPAPAGRYPYSGKISCEEHGTNFYRQLLKSSAGSKEVWQCRVYRSGGRAACSAPQLSTSELDRVLSALFHEIVPNKALVADTLVRILCSVPGERNYAGELGKLDAELTLLRAKKDRLLELSLAGGLPISEFRSRNDGFSQQMALVQRRQEAIRQERSQAKSDPGELRDALMRELESDVLPSGLAASFVKRIVVRRDSTSKTVHLLLELICGISRDVIYTREKFSFRLLRF